MRALKIKLYPHTYRDTTEIQHYAINKQCKDTMVQIQACIQLVTIKSIQLITIKKRK